MSNARVERSLFLHRRIDYKSKATSSRNSSCAVTQFPRKHVEKKTDADRTAVKKFDPQPKPGVEVFVGGLLRTMNQDDVLRILYSPSEEITEIKLARDRGRNRCRGYGFIRYRTHEHANCALQRYQKYEYQKGCYLKMLPLTESLTLFVSGLKDDWSPSDMCSFFTGNLINVKRVGPIFSKDFPDCIRPFCFVEFETHSDAKTALYSHFKSVSNQNNSLYLSPNSSPGKHNDCSAKVNLSTTSTFNPLKIGDNELSAEWADPLRYYIHLYGPLNVTGNLENACLPHNAQITENMNDSGYETQKISVELNDCRTKSSYHFKPNTSTNSQVAVHSLSDSALVSREMIAQSSYSLNHISLVDVLPVTSFQPSNENQSEIPEFQHYSCKLCTDNQCLSSYSFESDYIADQYMGKKNFYDNINIAPTQKHQGYDMLYSLFPDSAYSELNTDYESYNMFQPSIQWTFPNSYRNIPGFLSIDKFDSFASQNNCGNFNECYDPDMIMKPNPLQSIERIDSASITFELDKITRFNMTYTAGQSASTSPTRMSKIGGIIPSIWS